MGEVAGSERCSVKSASASDSGNQPGAVFADGSSMGEGCDPPRPGDGDVVSSSLERDGGMASSGVDGDSGEPEERAMCHEEGSMLEGWRQEVEAQVLRVLGMIR